MQQYEWHPDLLGDGFQCHQHELNPDEVGPRQVTVIKHLPALDPQMGKLSPFMPIPAYFPQEFPKLSKFAVLAVHGWNDYFYQVELARFISAIGGTFYAVDLARYGRSHRHNEPWGYTSNMRSYNDEISYALKVISAESGNIPVFLYGHSTGGLSTSIWAHDHSPRITGLILNSPWLSMDSSPLLNFVFYPLIKLTALLRPQTIIPKSGMGYYHQSLTGGHIANFDFSAEPDPQNDPFLTTGWNPDIRYRQVPSFPIPAGWLQAVRNAQAEVAKGLDIKVPVLVLTSDRHASPEEWGEEYLQTDSVLDVKQLWRLTNKLGTKVTVSIIPQAIHDIFFSRASARNHAYAQTYNWIQKILAN